MKEFLWAINSNKNTISIIGSIFFLVSKNPLFTRHELHSDFWVFDFSDVAN
jgi:hypothetical protein